jgi:hypothetical protein
MTKELVLSAITGIQAGNVNFSTAINAFVGNGYTSAAGNHYYNALRFADGIIIKEDIGQGYLHQFLNGLKIYSLKDKTLLAEETFYCLKYSRECVQSHAKRMLLNQLNESARYNNFSFNNHEAEQIIARLINDAFSGDQLAKADQQMRTLLT